MKKLILAFALIVAGLYTNAQQKIGYINSQEIISMMPEAKKVSADIEAYKKTYTEQMASMQKELETKYKAYQDGGKTMSDAIRTVKEKELQDLQSRMGSFEQTANEKIEAKLQELLAPVNDKAQKAIEAVAKEKGYSYIMDTSVGGIIYALPGDNILDAVKVKLAIKDTPASSTAPNKK
ncbi:outer membrane protein 26 [Filimonas sp.]|jgi:outer membrane protein|nr:outer membrane protein 26 [Filimonas sp.]